MLAGGASLARAVRLVSGRTLAALRVGRHLRRRGPALLDAWSVPGLCAAVIFGGKTVVAEAFGFADAATRRPMTTETPFPAASLAKPVMAAYLLRLKRLGLLDLRRPVNEQLVGWRLKGACCNGHDPAGVTAERLLSHSAGVGVHGYPLMRIGEPRPTTVEVLDGKLGEAVSIVQPPGEGALYSGGGYMIAQLLSESVTGMELERGVECLLLRPLGLKGTRFGGFDATDLASRHGANGAPLERASAPALGASGMVTTVNDLAAFFAAVMPDHRGHHAGRSVLSEEDAASMAHERSRDARGGRFGLGFYLGTGACRAAFMHSGIREGLRCHAEGIPSRRSAFALCVNGEPAEEPIRELARELRDLLLAEETWH